MGQTGAAVFPTSDTATGSPDFVHGFVDLPIRGMSGWDHRTGNIRRSHTDMPGEKPAEASPRTSQRNRSKHPNPAQWRLKNSSRHRLGCLSASWRSIQKETGRVLETPGPEQVGD